MATKAQVTANRSNAEKSTGPRTAEGKAAVAQNAVKHGLSGRLDVIKGEEQAEFDRHREALLAELAPGGAVESMLVERVVSLSWRLKRVERIQNEVFDALLADGSTPLAKLARSMMPGRSEDDEDLALGRAVVKDFSNSRVLDRLLMYERRMEHSLLKTLNDLQLRRLRVREYISRHMDEIGDEPAGSVPARASWRGGEAGGSESEGYTSRPPVGAFPPWRAPDGVTTNASSAEIPHRSGVPSFQYSTGGTDGPAADDESCKTNPIWPDPCETQASGGTGVTEGLAGDSQEETKPIIPAETGCPALVEAGVGD